MVHHILAGAVAVLDTVILGIIYMTLSPFDLRGSIYNFFVRLWSRVILIISGVKVKVTGLENVDKNQSYIIAANHQSHFDIPVLISFLPLSVRMIAKKELFRIPILGWSMYIAGHVSIDRESGKRALVSIKKASERIKRKKISIVIYPEGTRSPDGEVGEFKKGSFRLVLESKLPVLPVSIIGSRNILPKNSLRINKGEVGVVIGEPIITENIEKRDINELKEKTRSEIIKNMNITGEANE